MNRNVFLSRALVLLFFIFWACSDPQKSSTESQVALFTQYIGGYTSGVVKSSGSIRIRLTQDVEQAQSGQVIDEALFDFEPSIEGTTTWEDQRTIVFEPEERLPLGTRYQANFALHKVREVADELKRFSFSFQTVQQAYEVKLFGLETESLEDPEKYRLLGVVQTADFADQATIEEMLAAEQSGSQLAVRWTHEDDTHHRFEITDIWRREQTGELQVRWTGEPIDVETKGQETVVVPALGDYSVLSVDLVQNEEQYISILFSSPVATQQDLSGLLRIDGPSRSDTSPRWVVHKNEIKVYPSQEFLASLNEISVNVARDVKSWEGKKLSASFEKIIPLPKTEPEVELVANKGVIMVGEDQMILPFRAVGLKAVDVNIVQIFEDNVLQYLQVNTLGGNTQLKRVGRPVKRKRIDLEAAGVTDLNRWNRFTLDL